jgi:hypothetical protein
MKFSAGVIFSYYKILLGIMAHNGAALSLRD